MQAEFKLRCSQKARGQSAYSYLRSYFPFLPDPIWLAFVEQKNLLLDGQAYSDDSPLTAGQTLEFSINNYQEDPVNGDWRLLWQNQDLIAVHKPAGLPVSRTTRNIYHNLSALLQRDQWPQAQVLHRLDKDTAGVIMVAKTLAAATLWQSKIKQLIQAKTYQAIVYGCPSWQHKDFQCWLGRRDDSEIRSKMYVCPDQPDTWLAQGYIKPKHSHSEFKLLANNGRYSLLQCRLHTGRKHQLRAQLAYLGHAIVGDKMYAHQGQMYMRRLRDEFSPQDQQTLQTEHQLLFAQSINLCLPDNSPQQISSPHYPAEWQRFCAEQDLLV